MDVAVLLRSCARAHVAPGELAAMAERLAPSASLLELVNSAWAMAALRTFRHCVLEELVRRPPSPEWGAHIADVLSLWCGRARLSYRAPATVASRGLAGRE